MNTYYKMLYGTTSYGSEQPYEYEINKLNIHPDFDEDPTHNYGGFFVAEKQIILRFLTWGTTLYEVVVPDDSLIVNVQSRHVSAGVYKVNKMILTNPIQLTDELVLDLIKETKLPVPLWFNVISLCALHGFKKSALKIIELYVNDSNIESAIEGYQKYYNYRKGFMFGHIQADVKCADEIYQLLCEISNHKQKK